MKKSLLLLLPVMMLVACDSTPSSSETTSSSESSLPSSEEVSSSEEISSEEPSSETNPEEVIATALESVAFRSYEIEYEEIFTINYPGQAYYVGLYQHRNHKLGFYYSDENRAHRFESHSTFADLDVNTNEIRENTIRYRHVPMTLYEKNLVDGSTEVLRITVQNTLIAETLQTYDMDADTYSPVMYDDEFINPFESVKTTDLVLNSDGTITISNPKIISNVINCYSGVSKVSEGDTITLTLNENYEVNGMIFNIQDKTEGIRVSTGQINVSINVLEKDTYPTIRPFTNDNPNLEIALNKYKDLRNFTYTKQISVEGNLKYDVEGYYTEETVLFHHGSKDDEGLYEGGDDYDLKCVYNHDTNVYDVYQYLMVTNEYGWVQAMATEDVPYTIATFNDIGPRHQDVSAAVFKDIGNNQYQAEDLIASTIGQYFDYEVWGVDSFFLETQTLTCVVTLNEENDIVKVELTANLEGDTYLFTYAYENVGTTTIPEWIDA